MKILLVNNASLNKDKFTEQNELLLNTAKKMDIELDIKTNFEILTLLTKNGVTIKQTLDHDAILFYDKDTLLCQQLESMGYKVFNSSDCIASCDNKALMYTKLSCKKVNIPPTIILPLSFYYNENMYPEYIDNVISILGLPLIIKEWFGSWGLQVYLCKTKKEIIDIINKKQGRELLFQKYYPECYGSDVRINIVGEEIVASMKRKCDKHFQANISSGGSMEKYDPAPDEKALALSAHKALGCDFSGVDILQTQKGPIICEVNSNAHLLNIYKCTKINVAQKILDYIYKKVNKTS